MAAAAGPGEPARAALGGRLPEAAPVFPVEPASGLAQRALDHHNLTPLGVYQYTVEWGVMAEHLNSVAIDQGEVVWALHNECRGLLRKD